MPGPSILRSSPTNRATRGLSRTEIRHDCARRLTSSVDDGYPEAPRFVCGRRDHVTGKQQTILWSATNRKAEAQTLSSLKDAAEITQCIRLETHVQHSILRLLSRGGK
jgi:hypothetical protein